MKLTVKHEGKTIGEIVADRYLSIEDAMYILGADKLEVIESGDPDYMLKGSEIWYECIEIDAV